MATKDIPDWLLCEAAVSGQYGLFFILEHTGQPYKVCLRALERGYKRDVITCGSTGGAILCDKGEVLLAEHRKTQTDEERLAIAATIQRLEIQRAHQRPWCPEDLEKAEALMRGVNDALDRLLEGDE